MRFGYFAFVVLKKSHSMCDFCRWPRFSSRQKRTKLARTAEHPAVRSALQTRAPNQMRSRAKPRIDIFANRADPQAQYAQLTCLAPFWVANLFDAQTGNVDRREMSQQERSNVLINVKFIIKRLSVAGREMPTSLEFLQQMNHANQPTNQRACRQQTTNNQPNYNQVKFSCATN